jgi:hypothetical protein
MPVDQDERPTFYQGQYLGPDDLTAAVDYGRIQIARHILGAHTLGIAIGLQLIEKPSTAGNNAVDVFLEPGYAWDGFGRAIVVLSPYKIPAALFQNIVYDGSIDNPSGHLVKIWLQYSENANQPPAVGFQACDATGQTARVQETFSVQIGDLTNVSDQRDPLSIGGKTVDALLALSTFDPSAKPVYDLSIPQQALPEDNAAALWLIPVGYVRWLPGQTATQSGAFQQRTAADLAISDTIRQYIGVVAGSVEAPGSNLEIKARGTAPSTIPSDDLLWVDGPTRVQGDVSLLNSRLVFLNAGGKDDGIPLLLQRAAQQDQSTPPKTLTSLQIEIGADNKGNNMLSVGPLSGPPQPDTPPPPLVQVLNVLDNGKVGIGTLTPQNPLGIRGAGSSEDLISFEDASGSTKWHINQKVNGTPGLNFAETGVADFRLFLQPGGKVGIGTQTPAGRLTLAGIIQPAQGNVTFFSQTADIEYDGGNDQLFLIRATGSASTAFIGGKIGIGTTTPSNMLHVSDPNGIRQGYLYLSGDVGWQSLTYNAYHDAQGSGWVFPDPTRPAVTIEMDDAGGRGRFDVWSTPTTNKTGWIQRLRIDGETGNVGINTGIAGINGKLTIIADAASQGRATFFTPTGDLEYDGGTDQIFVFRATAGAKTVFAGGNFGINVLNPAAPLDVSGDVHITGDLTANGNNYPSDVRLKRNVERLEDALSKILRLRGMRFLWRDPDKHGGRSGPQMGLIAQDVEEVFPDWVKDGVDGYKVIGHRGLEALLIEAIRELKAQVDTLAKQIQINKSPEAL